jgi:oligoribonuclease
MVISWAAFSKAVRHDRHAAPAAPALRDGRSDRCDEMSMRPTSRTRCVRENGSSASPWRDALNTHPPGAPMTDTLLKKSENNLIWVDMEMTGLLPDTDRIIEVAVVITDPQLTVRVEGPVFAIHQSDATLDAMDAWNKGTHGRSGLIDRVKASTVTEEQAEAELIEWMSQYVPKGKSPMCGNSICQDRRFMARTMPALEAFFHYRNLDVSTLKELAKRWKPSALDGLKKAGKHTALADVQESIDELVHYRATLLAL